MCLSIAVESPDSVLETGFELGYEWVIVYNYMGYRCGYVKVSQDHHLYGKNYFDDEILDLDVHGGITFAEADAACEALGEDNGWWLGFDCAHAGDMPDLELFETHIKNPELKKSAQILIEQYSKFALFRVTRSQDYVREECLSLAKQLKEIQGEG